MFRVLNRAVLAPVAGLTLGTALFIRTWPTEAGAITLNDAVVPHMRSTRQVQRPDILKKISETEIYNKLLNNPNMSHLVQSEKIPSGHRDYHVGQGELFGAEKLEIDPLIFYNEKDGELVVFYHLGKGLGNEKGSVHKGILSLLLDEGLCYCGFPKLPSKRGVTARLDLNFTNDLPADSTVVLRASIAETKGRKCVIEGTLETLPTKYWMTGKEAKTGTVIAEANCILVEPKWFKYLKWVDLF